MSCDCMRDSPLKLIYACSGATNTGFLESAKAADESIVIDGCPIVWGKQIFKITDFGVEKGKTKIDDEIVEDVQRRMASTLLGLKEMV